MGNLMKMLDPLASLSLAEYGAHLRMTQAFETIGLLPDGDSLLAVIGARGEGERMAVERVIALLWSKNAAGQIEPVGKPKHSLSEDFSEFYRAYPRKKGRLHAEKAYARARRMASHADIMAGLSAYVASCRGSEAHYVKHPATWLNSGGWMDEPDENRSPLMQAALDAYGEYIDA